MSRAIERRIQKLENHTTSKSGVTVLITPIGTDGPIECVMRNGRPIPLDSPERFIPNTNPIPMPPRPLGIVGWRYVVLSEGK